MIKELRTKFQAKGFEVGKDISWQEWQKLIAEFVTLQDLYANMFNQVIGQINDVWSKYEDIRAIDATIGGCGATLMARMVMGVDVDASYSDWMEKWMKDICEIVDESAENAGFRLRSDLFREDDIPMFGTKFKDREDWKVLMTLEAVEE